MPFTVERFRALSAQYRRVIDDGLVGFGPFTQLQPWDFLPDEEIFDVAEQWPSSESERPLIAFAVRQDCDDIACFEVHDGEITSVLVIEGWSEGSYSPVARYGSFEEWFNRAKNEIAG